MVKWAGTDETIGANPYNLCLQIRDKIEVGRDPEGERRLALRKSGGSERLKAALNRVLFK